MYFEPTPDQQSIRSAVREFARAELAPGYLARAQSDEFPWHLHQAVAKLGTFGLLAGAEHNPLSDTDFVAAGLVIEELAYADFNLANAAIPAMLIAALIADHASVAVRERWLAPIVRGELYVGLCLTEPDTGSDVAAIRTTATATGDGYVLRGEKTSVTMLRNSAAVVVIAKTYRGGEYVGPSAFLVPTDSPGIATSAVPDTGWRPLARGVLHLDDVAVPAFALMAAEGAAFRTLLGGFDFTRPLLALTGIGCAQACVDETANYLKQRQVFGSPLASFEGASFPLAEHATRLQAARLLCYSALWHRAEGRPHTALAAMCKWFGPEQASRTVHDCLLLHGNYGYSTELPFEQRLRDVLAVEIADGTAQIQKIIIARDLFGREFVPYRR